MRAGRLAQLVEHLLYTQGVGSSSLSPPTSEVAGNRGIPTLGTQAQEPQGSPNVNANVNTGASISFGRTRRPPKPEVHTVPVEEAREWARKSFHNGKAAGYREGRKRRRR